MQGIVDRVEVCVALLRISPVVGVISVFAEHVDMRPKLNRVVRGGVDADRTNLRIKAAAGAVKSDRLDRRLTLIDGSAPQIERRGYMIHAVFQRKICRKIV